MLRRNLQGIRLTGPGEKGTTFGMTCSSLNSISVLLTQRIGPLGDRRSTVRSANGGNRTNLIFGTLDTIDVFVEINESSDIEASHAVTWHNRTQSISPYSN